MIFVTWNSFLQILSDNSHTIAERWQCGICLRTQPEELWMAVHPFANHPPFPIIFFFSFLGLRWSHIFGAAIPHKHFLPLLRLALLTHVNVSIPFQRKEFKASVCLVFLNSNVLSCNVWMRRSNYETPWATRMFSGCKKLAIFGQVCAKIYWLRRRQNYRGMAWSMQAEIERWIVRFRG